MRDSGSPMRAPVDVAIDPLLTSTRATRPSWSITQSPRGAFVSTAYLHPLVPPLGAANPPPIAALA